MSEYDDPRVTPAAVAMVEAKHRLYSDRIRSVLDAADAADREAGIVRVNTRDEAIVERVAISLRERDVANRIYWPDRYYRRLARRTLAALEGESGGNRRPAG